MAVRNVGKWMCVALIAWTSGSAVASCGGTGASSVFVDGGGAGDGGVGSTDATTGHDGPTFGGDDSGDSMTSCVPEDVHGARVQLRSWRSAAERSSTAGATPPTTSAVPRARRAAPAGPTCAGPARGERRWGGERQRELQREDVRCQQGYDCGFAPTGAATSSTATPTTRARDAWRPRTAAAEDTTRAAPARRRRHTAPDDLPQARLQLRRGRRRVRQHPPVRDVHVAAVLRRRGLRSLRSDVPRRYATQAWPPR
jgi:hypothetical protein